jgi:tetratricopeptide (TPR) repeat protein
MKQIKSLQQLEEIIQKETNDTVKFRLVQELADESVAEGKLQYAFQLYTKALSIAEKIHDLKLECETLIDLGSTAKNLGQTEDAIELYEKALENARKMRDFGVQSDILGKLAIIYRDIGKLDLAANYFERASDAAHIANPSTVTVREEQITSNSISGKTARNFNISLTFQKSIEIKNFDEQTKLIDKVLRGMTIFFVIFFVIVIIISCIYILSNPILVLAISGLIILLIAGIILTYLGFRR